MRRRSLNLHQTSSKFLKKIRVFIKNLLMLKIELLHPTIINLVTITSRKYSVSLLVTRPSSQVEREIIKVTVSSSQTATNRKRSPRKRFSLVSKLNWWHISKSQASLFIYMMYPKLCKIIFLKRETSKISANFRIWNIATIMWPMRCVALSAQ